MTVSTDRLIQLPLGDSSPDRSGIAACVERNFDACATAASLWARLHYEHAAYVENSLSIRDISFRSETEGSLSLNFDWLQQDGCSDICRDGRGHVDFQFRISNEQLELTWSLPERPGTADEF
ncbi:hypothetical protein GC176_10860 [bacterium]|nr:hypothetical protein [bacterium]